MSIKKDKYGAKTYETGTALCNKTGRTCEYSIVDNGTPTFMLHIAHRAYTSETLKEIKVLLKGLSIEHDFTVNKDKETKLQHS
jgi:hypothetical protein